MNDTIIQKNYDSAKDYLHQSKLSLLTKYVLRIFGCILHRFDLVLLDCPIDDLTASCGYHDKKLTIKLNVIFIAKHVMNIRQFMFLMLHEIMHFLHRHIFEIYKVGNIEAYRYASDHVINRVLLQDSQTVLFNIIEPIPGFCFTIPELMDQDLTTMEVYQWLLDRLPPQGMGKNGNSDDSEGGRDGGSKENPFDPNGESIMNDLTNKYGLTAEDKTVLENEITTIHSEIRTVIELITEKNKGNQSGSIFKMLKKLTEVEIPWDKIIENCINTTLTVSPSNRSWKNINKRMAYYNFLMPYKGLEEEKDNLYILQDTSASITIENLHKFTGIIKKSAWYFKTIKVIQHDQKITSEKDFSSFDLLNENLEIFKIYGRGGTSHYHCFEKIEKNYVDNEAIGLVLCLTDFESDIQNIWANYKWKDEIPFKLLLTKHLSSVPEHIDNSPIAIK